jgi:hypothetical protein
MHYDMQRNTMNTTDENNADENNADENINDKSIRPFGFWVAAVDRLLRAEFATVFEDEGITRRDWRMLNRIDGTFAAAAASDRPLHARKLGRLLELGWVERTPEGWTLSESGALAKQRLGVAVDEIRSRVAGAVSPEEYAILTSSLEKIAREFGWAEDRRLPRHEGRFDRRHPGRRHGQHRGERFGRFGHGERFGRFGHGERFEDSGPGEHPGRRRFGRPNGEDCGHRAPFPRHGAPGSHIHIHHH